MPPHSRRVVACNRDDILHDNLEQGGAMVRWLRNRIHRIYVYFFISLPGVLHTMTHTDAQSNHYLYLIGAVCVASLCLARVIYVAGRESGIKVGQYIAASDIIAQASECPIGLPQLGEVSRGHRRSQATPRTSVVAQD